jgi:hypothetical protein
MVSFRYHYDECGNKCFETIEESNVYIKENNRHWKSFSIFELKHEGNGIYLCGFTQDK